MTEVTKEFIQKNEDEKIIEIEIERLRSFKNHPFQVKDDNEMHLLKESIEKYGILTPLIVRPVPDGVYEIIAGHRRRHAAELLGYRKVPVIIRVMNEDEAILNMVDSNLHREKISFSEKAFAYKMKQEAMKHQGSRTDLTLGQNVPKPRRLDVESISAKTGAGRKTYRPPQKRPGKALQIQAFPGAKFPRTISACGAYMPASAPAGQSRRRPGSSTAAARPGERPCRTPGRAGFPPRPPRSATFPARDQGAAPPNGNSGNKRPSSTCPAYSRDSPAASSHSLYHSWRTTLSPACGSPPFPAGSIHGSCLPPVLGLSCSR